jgi:hypothetical protein
MDEKFMRARVLGQAIRRGWGGYAEMFRDPNIVGTAIGRRFAGDQVTDTPALVVYVMKKVSTSFLPPSRVLPRRIYVGRDYIDVDVIETGPFYPLEFTARERPAPSGISIGHPAVTAGTLGCLVTDNTDGTLCILSNNHVIANQNAASIGDRIIQPGTADGGVSPADDIATLKRFVAINATGNTVDGAIAQVIDSADVIAEFKDRLMPYPGADHPAVGLLFAGSCNRTIMNPIANVLAQLDISLLAGAGAIVGPDIGMNVEKVGRTTEYTTSTILEVDATVTIGYDFGSATFDHQIVTAWMSDGGDSGSVVCRGGAGGQEDRCGCATVATAARVLGVDDLSVDAAVEKEFREKYLSHTRVGRYAIEVFFANETMVLQRVRGAGLSKADHQFAHRMYEKHIQTVRQALLQPFRSEVRLSREHLADGREALGRAMKYMSKEEKGAAERLFRIADRAEGKTAGEILEMLNDEAIYREVVDILSTVPTLRHTRPADLGDAAGPGTPPEPAPKGQPPRRGR